MNPTRIGRCVLMLLLPSALRVGQCSARRSHGFLFAIPLGNLPSPGTLHRLHKLLSQSHCSTSLPDEFDIPPSPPCWPGTQWPRYVLAGRSVDGLTRWTIPVSEHKRTDGV